MSRKNRGNGIPQYGVWRGTEEEKGRTLVKGRAYTNPNTKLDSKGKITQHKNKLKNINACEPDLS